MVGTRPLDSENLLRALAIMGVVLLHAHDFVQSDSFATGGGMTVLMMLSGISFARFALQGASANQVPAKSLRFAWMVFWPSLLLVLFYFVVRNQFSLPELLFVSNWVSLDRVSMFPVWYVQVIVQMMLAFALVFSVPWVRTQLREHPLAFVVVAYLGAVIVRYALPEFVWDTAPLKHKLPHLFLWNFAMGWVIYFCLEQRRMTGSRLAVLLGLACVLLGAYVAWDPRTSDFWALSLAGAMVILVPHVPLPVVLHRALLLISQATFVIFLVHREVLAVLIATFEGSQFRPLFLFVGAMAGSFLAWMALESAVRAYRSRSARLRERQDARLVM
jgi:peptidoglycan/LPS O-acetylase OafA/YrhL